MIVEEIEQVCTLFNGDTANQCKDLLDTYLGDVLGYLIQQLVSIIKLDLQFIKETTIFGHICILFNDASKQCKDLLDTYLKDVFGYFVQQLVSILVVKLDSQLLVCSDNMAFMKKIVNLGVNLHII